MYVMLSFSIRMHVRYGLDAIEYARGLAGGEESCEDKALATLLDMRKKTPQYQQSADGSLLGTEKNFQAVCNASVVMGADEHVLQIPATHTFCRATQLLTAVVATCVSYQTVWDAQHCLPYLANHCCMMNIVCMHSFVQCCAELSSMCCKVLAM